MKVAIRADASAQIGTGHLMRCLTLADGLAALGAETVFLCAPASASWRYLIEARGYRCLVLAPDAAPRLACDEATQASPTHSTWLPWGQAADAAAVRAVLSTNVDWMVVDHYALDARWERAVRDRTARILVVDDLADRDHDCDVLLDHNPQVVSGERYADLLPARAIRLIGPLYALLRPEFARVRRPPGCGPIRRINVFMGGADAVGATVLVLDALAGPELAALPVDVMTGGASPQLSTIRDRARRRGNTTVHVDTPEVASLLAAADLAIGAGGVAALERCCVGIASVTVSVAVNQDPALAELARLGAVLHAGRLEDIDASVLRQLTARLAADEVQRRTIATTAASVADGEGVARVLAVLCDLSRG
jgi:UDP-2,4-diacetamido-2,4,6-trideoxy-beta-L-altropyranose hydrolase